MSNKFQKFGTVLIARPSTQSPSELELVLPNWSTLVRVVPQLSGGAHFLLPGKNGAASVAVRVYDETNISKMDEEYKKRGEEKWRVNKPGEDVDGLCSFRDTYKCPVVFFVLSQGSMQDKQLSNMKSFTMRAQMALASAQSNPTDKNVSLNRSLAKVFIVQDTHTILRTLSSITRSIEPEKVLLQKKFFDERAKQYGLPDVDTGAIQSEMHLAMHTCTAIRNWAKRFEIERGDEDVLMSLVGTVLGISSADQEVLSNTPIDDKTMDIVLAFFGKPIPNRENQSVGQTAFDNYYESPFLTNSFNDMVVKQNDSMHYVERGVDQFYLNEENPERYERALSTISNHNERQMQSGHMYESENETGCNNCFDTYLQNQFQPPYAPIPYVPVHTSGEKPYNGGTYYQTISRSQLNSQSNLVSKDALSYRFPPESSFQSQRQLQQGSRDWRPQLQNQFTPIHTGNQSKQNRQIYGRNIRTTPKNFFY